MRKNTPQTLSHTYYSWLCDVLIHGFYIYFHFITTAHCTLHRHTTQMVPRGPSQEPFPLRAFPISELSGPCFVSLYWSTFSLNHSLNCSLLPGKRSPLKPSFYKGEKLRELYNSFKNVAVNRRGHTPSFHRFMQSDSKCSFVCACVANTSVINPDNSLAETFS